MLLAVYRRLKGKSPGDRFFLFSALGLLLQGLNRLVALELTWTPTAFNVRFGVMELLTVLVTCFMFTLTGRTPHGEACFPTPSLAPPRRGRDQPGYV